MMKLFLKNSNLCDYISPTSQTDGQTDRQTTCDRNTALCTKVHRAVKTEIKQNCRWSGCFVSADRRQFCFISVLFHHVRRTLEKVRISTRSKIIHTRCERFCLVDVYAEHGDYQTDRSIGLYCISQDIVQDSKLS